MALFIQKGDGFGNASKGPFESNDPKSTIQPLDMTDPMVKARRIWKKGRFEFMSGPVIFSQCHGVTEEQAKGYSPLIIMPGEKRSPSERIEDNNRVMGYSPAQSFYKDEATEDLGVDIQE